MANSDLIDFNVIEEQKENIQSLPSGRSAKALAALYSPPLTSNIPNANTPDIHASKRASFEQEVAQIDEADDPLDVYDRYVKWTLDAYPSAQSTSQSQLLPLLERATKALLQAEQYKNDARYLKLWLLYLQLFSDAPRETFVFLARHGVGESLALYYEEFAAWFERTGKWSQAEEVYRMGIEKGARPTERLARRFAEFETRFAAVSPESVRPASPVLLAVRPALAAKVDPFASVTAPAEGASQQQPQQQQGSGSTTQKKKGNKMAIFSDESEAAQQSVLGSTDGKGWESLGSLASRKKENAVEAKAWAGETLKTGRTNTGVPKMAIFKSSSPPPPQSRSKKILRPSLSQSRHEAQRSINPKTGRQECVFVNLEAVYPDPENPLIEFCFEELRARHRGWARRDWAAEKRRRLEEAQTQSSTQTEALQSPQIVRNLEHGPPASTQQTISIDQENLPVSPQETQEQQPLVSLDIFRDVQPESAAVSQSPAALAEPEPLPEKRAPSKKCFTIFEDDGSATANEKAARAAKPVAIDTSLKGLSIGGENDENAPPSRQQADLAKKIRREERANRTRKIRVVDVQHVQKETQTIQLNLASPTGPKIRRKKTAEPTMTLNTKEAMEEIYGIFSEPIKVADENADEEDDEEDSDSDDDDYTSGGESTTTGKMSANVSEYGDETRNEIMQVQQQEQLGEQVENEEDDGADVTGWSDFTKSKHVPATEEETLEEVRPPKMQVFQEVEHEPKVDSVPTAQREALVTPSEEEDQEEEEEERSDVKYVPLPPEDYEPVTQLYRSSAYPSNNRLPFMTPIVERTESSLGIATVRTEKDYFTSKTPSRPGQEPFEPIAESIDDELPSSPFDDMFPEAAENRLELLQPIRTKTTKGIVDLKSASTGSKNFGRALAHASEPITKGPFIKDAQCNPVDPILRESILAQIRPPLSSYSGYSEHRDVDSGRAAEIRRFAKAVGKKGSSSNADRTSTTVTLPPGLSFDNSQQDYTVRRELGAGAFAPVYLIESQEPVDEPRSDENDENAPARMGKGAFASVQRKRLEAMKMEDNPPSAWEFYMIRQAHRRLGVHRAAESIVHAHEMHIYKDTGFLIEEYRDQGTLLDLVNLSRADASLSCTGSASNSGGMDETLAMFFTVELLRTVEQLHKHGIVHGDLKADNVLVRLSEGGAETGTNCRYDPTAASVSWASKGVTLIDFGRGIDMKVFSPQTQFVADWPTSSADCAEMREMRPWTYQVDYHGLAGTVHSMLFGKYMSTLADKGPQAAGIGAGKTYRIRESLKRYWQTELWSALFSLLLNPTKELSKEDGARMPVLKGMKEVREGMEGWMMANSEKGVGLKKVLGRCEEAVSRRKK